MFSDIDVVVVGAGYVGLTLSLFMADKGLSVFVVDKDSAKINSLKKGKSTIGEQDIEGKLNECLEAGGIRFSEIPPLNAPAWVMAISYFPGKPELYIKALDIINGTQTAPPLVIIRGTVPIGFSISKVLPALEKRFSGKLDKDFFLASCPERTLSGAAFEELSSLPQIVAGTDKSIQKAKNLFEKSGINCLSLPTLEAGELAKVFANYARLVEFNLANFLGVLCHQFDISEETMIKNISAGYGRLNFLKTPGPGVGGFCLPKDALVLHDGLKEKKAKKNSGLFEKLSQYPLQEYELNKNIISFHTQQIQKLTEDAKHILAFGVAFKGVPKTDDTRDSVGLIIVKELMKSGKKVSVFDLTVKESHLEDIGLTYISNINHLSNFDALLLLNNDPDYKLILTEALKRYNGSSIILYDPWRLVTTGNESIFQKNYSLQTIKGHVN